MTAVEPTMLAADLGLLKSVATIVLFVFFTGLLIWLTMSPADRYKQAARLPLADDDYRLMDEPEDEGAPQA